MRRIVRDKGLSHVILVLSLFPKIVGLKPNPKQHNTLEDSMLKLVLIDFIAP